MARSAIIEAERLMEGMEKILFHGSYLVLVIASGLAVAFMPSFAPQQATVPTESTKTVLACDRSPEGMTIIRDESTGLVEHLRSWEYGERIARVGVKFIEPAKAQWAEGKGE